MTKDMMRSGASRSPSPDRSVLPNLPGVTRNPVGPKKLNQSMGYSAQGYMMIDDPQALLKKTLKGTGSLASLPKGAQLNRSATLNQSYSSPILTNSIQRPNTVGGFRTANAELQAELDDLASAAPTSMSSTFYSSLRTSWEPAREATGFHDLDGRLSLTRQRQNRARPIRDKAAPLSAPPRYLAHDRQVLRFQGYYLEGVEDSRVETRRVRRVWVQYYLEDGTVDAHEARVANSGLPQGVLCHRHRVPRPGGAPRPAGLMDLAPDDDAHVLGWEDLELGGAVLLYGKEVHLVDADAATRAWLEAQTGFPPPPPRPYPDDQFSQHMTAKQQRETGADPSVPRNRRMHPMKAFMEARLGKPADRYDVPQFLARDGQVLRFDALWDDTARLYGDVMPFTVLYYLADDTMEVLAVRSANSGRPAFPKMLQRGGALQYDEDYHARGTGQFYGWEDLRVGGALEVFGRPLLLVDADGATRAFYEGQGRPLRPRAEPFRKQPARVPVQVPPANGWGSEADSLENCRLRVGAAPRPRRDPPAEEDRVALRFAATLRDPRHPADRLRRFIVAVYLSDDTVGVHEPPVTNSGVVGGTFLKRMKVKKNQTEFYAPKDFYVGAAVKLHTHRFELADADLATVRYMERYPAKFPKADPGMVARRCRTYREKLAKALAEHEGGAFPEAALAAAFDAVDCRVARHEVFTLARAASALEDPSPVPVGQGMVSHDKLMELLDV
eukprot:CAMPEP_0194705348 /NCGR_PEP_ID=MMETSP0295-20121207/28872_1 /TAXON_ID=39354 /ORGANISM="Heterosigma akashiwo, Strain CCMP2393" /LENGTH=725 /DNA_ID=CAMNT_0039601001 /DNA_START=261 /DNA_END=2438 /DNA_ORIENTATION=+